MAETKKQQNGKSKELAVSQRFVHKVEEQYKAELGNELDFHDYEATLAQHLYLKISETLQDLEEKRIEAGKDKMPYKWQNLNLKKLYLDSTYRVALGLDALLKNHIHPIPYWNKKQKKYDLDLRIGYRGEDYCKRRLSIYPIVDIIYELVHENDAFKPLKRNHERRVENYEFNIDSPFDRGEVVGGFGYIMYENPHQNTLIIVTKEDFDKSRSLAQTDEFWSKNEREMQFKTLVHRVTSQITIDPRKVHSKAYARIEEDLSITERQLESEIEDTDNGEVIDFDPEPEEPKTESGQLESEPEVEEDEWDYEEEDPFERRQPEF